MDWYKQAQMDWEVYHDKTRIKKYVQYGKITPVQYESIVGEPYVV